MYNIPGTFIDDIWGGSWLHFHMKAKWARCAKDHGGHASASAIMDFAGQLDTVNGRMFYQYIDNYIKTHRLQ